MIPRWIAAALALSFVGDALASSEPPTGVERAIQDLQECKNVDAPVCRALPQRLANYGDDVVGPLASAFPRLALPAQILAAMGAQRIDTRPATSLLIRLAATGSYVVRSLALEALGQRKGRKVDRALAAAMADENPVIRVAAAEAIGMAENQRVHRVVVPALVRASADDSMLVRVAVIESLGMLGARNALDVVLNALDSRDTKLRRTALFSLRFINDRRSVPHVIEVLKDDDHVTVRDAGSTLQRITGVDLGTDYELWKSWWVEQGQ